MNDCHLQHLEKATLPLLEIPQGGRVALHITSHLNDEMDEPETSFQVSQSWIKDQNYPLKKKYLVEKNKNAWVKSLTHELVSTSHGLKNLNIPSKYEGKIDLNLQIDKKHRIISHNNIFITGHVKCTFTSICTKCAHPHPQVLSAPISAISLPQRLENDPAYSEITEYDYQDCEYEVYFHDDFLRPLILVREQLFMNFNYQFVHSETCKGLCPICGKNLNLSYCLHDNKRALEDFSKNKNSLQNPS